MHFMKDKLLKRKMHFMKYKLLKWNKDDQHATLKIYDPRTDCKTFTTQTFTTPDVHHLRRSPPPV